MRGKEQLSPVDSLKVTYSIPLVRESDFLERGDLRLYLPRAFKATTMMVGNPDSPIALCTGWSDPWDVVTPETVEAFSVIAPLREPLGVDIVLHNLLANPQIRAVVLHCQGRLDGTETAQRAVDILRAIWKEGVDDDGVVNGISYRLFPELVKDGMIERLREMVADVRLIEFDGTIEAVVAEKGKWMFSPSLRERIITPEFKIPEVERWPSEEVSFQLREKSAFQGWTNLVGSIMRYGQDCLLEKGGALVRELPYARVVLEGNPDYFFTIPDWADEIEAITLTPESLEAYYQNYIRPERYMQEIYPGVWKFVRPSEERYVYAELIFAFPRPREIDLAAEFILEKQGIESVFQWLDDNFEIEEEKRTIAERLMKDDKIDDEKKAKILLEIFVPPTNQLADKIRRIREMPDDADKTIILWDPKTHGTQDRGRPCWIELNFLVRDRKIHAKSLFRSHDIAKGWPFNAYGIWRLWQDVCQETGYQMGTMTIESESAHVYKGDEPWIRAFCEKRLEETKPQLVFNPERADARGNLVVSVVEDEITCILVSPDGQPLCEIRGRTAKRVMAEINRLGLISRIDHAADIGMEVMKAEACWRLRIPYEQDKPLPWGDLV